MANDADGHHMTIRVALHDAPKYYSRRGTFYRRLIELATGEPTTVVEPTDRNVDLMLSSVHPSRRSRAYRDARNFAGRLIGNPDSLAIERDTRSRHIGSNRAAKIWFTGENLRPPADGWDLTFSFDLDPLAGSNIYLPLWWESVGLIGEPTNTFVGVPPTIESMMTGRSRFDDRPEFVCAFIGRPTAMRNHAIRMLSKIGRVDVYGKAVGRPVRSKLQIARRYRYCLCFENDLYPGYVTEKPLEAWMTGAVPIWWGSDPAGFLNPSAVINYAEMASMEELGAEILSLERDAEGRRAISQSPILLRRPTLDQHMGAIRSVLGRTSFGA